MGAAAPDAEMVPPTTGAAASDGFGASFGGCEGGDGVGVAATASFDAGLHRAVGMAREWSVGEPNGPQQGDTVWHDGQQCTVQYVNSKGLLDLRNTGGAVFYGVAKVPPRPPRPAAP